MGYTEEEAEKLIKKCTSDTCALTKHDHEIFYEYEKRKLMGKETYYLFPSDESISKWLNRHRKDDDKWKVTFDEYGNKTIHLGVEK